MDTKVDDLKKKYEMKKSEQSIICVSSKFFHIQIHNLREKKLETPVQQIA